MTSLADKAILSGANNRPPMLEKDMYDSWKSRMELYMHNRQHGRMILESVEHVEAIQADCDVKATNIILQGLPLEVYALEQECKLYDEFDKLTYWKGHILRDFYLRFSLLLNDMNIYTCLGLTTSAAQANLSTSSAVLSPTLISTTSINISDFSICNIISHSSVCLTRTIIIKSSISYPVTDTSSIVNHNAYMASSSAPQIDYAPMVQHSSEYSPPETGLVVPVFKKRDDPIDAINHMMSFLTAVFTSRRQNFMSAGLSRPFTSGSGGASGKQRVIACYNCKGEVHMSKQFTKPKRKRDAEWFKDKVILVQAQANGQVLQEEELEFLEDP
uniref:CCHC-type domain-containing protein n=1 Tax=Tanacetum cinerariifolium TaxID=118510 RepID=A0A699KQ85_TANCI|nr:hypothetical protein [Tanacetum cinerariifolium]